jgi:hypothetical protein
MRRLSSSSTSVQERNVTARHSLLQHNLTGSCLIHRRVAFAISDTTRNFHDNHLHDFKHLYYICDIRDSNDLHYEDGVVVVS